MRRWLAAVVMTLAMAGPATAVSPDEQLPNAAQEARARELSRELRCVVCQNQSIDDSDAGLAKDLRILLRERIAAGDTDAEAKAYIVRRYGDFVLLRPPMKGSTLVLWLGPLLVLAIGVAGVAAYLRGRARPETGKLDAAEEAELAKLLTPDEAA